MAIKNVTATELKQWIDNDEVHLIDVREDIEHASFHIEHSTHLPLGKITTDTLPKSDKKMVIYCLRGARGQKACEVIASSSQGVNIYNLEGGITAWKDAGLPVNKSEKQHFPLDRQVQITVGGTVLLSTLLSLSVAPAMVWVAAFFGAGLLFAGLSGTCMLAQVLAKMPWNRVA